MHLKSFAAERSLFVTVALLIAVGVTSLSAGARSADPPPRDTETKLDRDVKVDGFSARYNTVATPRKNWNDPDATAAWFQALVGRIRIDHSVSYRRVTLTPGEYDTWVEKGENGWYYLRVGTREDDSKPRLKAAFKLYEQEDGVEKLELALKLVAKGKKLKFSIRAGSWEGHGNLRIDRKKPEEIDEP